MSEGRPEAADAQASGGAGSNPASQGLAADQRVVPPPAAIPVNPVAAMSDEEFARQLRALMRSDPACFENMIRRYIRRSQACSR